MNPSKSLRLALTLAAICAVRDATSAEVKIVRDNWGVPHITSPTDEGACFGLGYAQAADRLGEMMKNFRRAEGTMAEAFGPEHFESDTMSRLLDHVGVSRERYAEISPRSRALIEAFVAGINAFIKEHPAEVPSWSVDVQPWRVVALGKYFTASWPLGDALGDLRRAGVRMADAPYLGSNEWVVSADRTAVGAPIALIDPHLSWYDQYRFYECRLYGKTIRFSGFGLVGSALPSLGHNEYCSIAMTTGSGDTADIFEEKLNPANKLQYEVDGEWREMTTRRASLGSGDQKKDLTIRATRHGPVVAEKNGKAYALANPYADRVRLVDQVYDMITARNLSEMKSALARLELMGQNVMIATVDGDIYYQRTGRIPIRAQGVDPMRPIPGHVTKNDWLGLHPADDLVQIANPDQGYMQNCNVSPVAMMDESPLLPSKYPAYLYGGEDPQPHQRAAAALESLRATDRRKLTIEGAMNLAMSVTVHGADHWQARLDQAWKSENFEAKAAEDETALFRLIRAWDGKSTTDSYGATAYLYWKREIPAEGKPRDRWGGGPGPSLTDAQTIDAMRNAAERMREEHGSVRVAYGELFRVGRRAGDGAVSKTYPVGGGNLGGGLDEAGMATLRAIEFSRAGDSGPWIGESGQTSTQIVVLSRPPKSWTVMPLGESDNPDSSNWDDQAEKLFSKGLMKPTYFLDPAALDRVKTSEKILQYE